MRQKEEKFMIRNYELLEKLIDERSSKDQVAKLLEIDKSTLYRKLKRNGRSFSVEEAKKIAKGLPLTNQEALFIFFNYKVAKVRQNKQTA
jgi:IS30 family transposase